MKLLVAFLVCCVAAATATSGSSFEYGLADDVHEFLGQFVESIRQHFQKALDQLKEKIQKHRFIFELLKSQIGVIQNKILQLAKDKLLEKAGEIRDRILDLFKTYLEKLNHKEDEKIEDAFYDIEEGSFIDRLAARIKTSLDNFLATVMEKVEKYSDIANDIKDRIVAIKEKLQEIPKAGAFKLLEIAAKVKEQLKSLLQEVIERISLKEEAAVYALYDANDEGFLSKLSLKIQEQLQRFLARIVELVNKYTDIASDISDRVVAIKEKLQEIPKAGFTKLVEIAGKIREQLKALLKETVDKIAKKHEEPAGYALYDSEEGSFIDRLADRIKTSLDNFLATVMEKVEKYSDIANDIKDRIVAIKEKLQEIPKAGAFKLLEIAAKVKEQLKSLLQEVVERISRKQVAEYSLMSLGGETLIESMSRVVRGKLQAVLDGIKDRLAQHKDLFEEVKSKIEDIQEHLNQMAKATLSRIVSTAQIIKNKIADLVKTLAGRITGITVGTPFADGLRKPGDASRRRLQTHLDELKKRVAKYPEVQAKYQDKLDDLQSQVDAVADLSGFNLATTSSQVLRKIGALRTEILNIIGTKRPGSF